MLRLGRRRRRRFPRSVGSPTTRRSRAAAVALTNILVVRSDVRDLLQCLGQILSAELRQRVGGAHTKLGVSQLGQFLIHPGQVHGEDERVVCESCVLEEVELGRERRSVCAKATILLTNGLQVRHEHERVGRGAPATAKGRFDVLPNNGALGLVDNPFGQHSSLALQEGAGDLREQRLTRRRDSGQLHAPEMRRHRGDPLDELGSNVPASRHDARKFRRGGELDASDLHGRRTRQTFILLGLGLRRDRSLECELERRDLGAELFNVSHLSRRGEGQNVTMRSAGEQQWG